MAGTLGGVALSNAAAKRGGRKTLGVRPLAKPKVKIRSQDVASVAKDIGTFGEQMGKFATEMRETREAAAGGRRRSPIEVVLQGLTARR